ncbi:MAG: TIGR03862 family flavoprotein [Pseudomonadota bacterium]
MGPSKPRSWVRLTGGETRPYDHRKPGVMTETLKTVGHAKPKAVIIGGGPAGLMAAQAMLNTMGGNAAEAAVILCDAMPTVGRKFLMAGKSGLNITKDEPDEAFIQAYGDAAQHMAPMLDDMGPGEVKRFAEDLRQPVFTGSSGMVFPRAMKASPLLRAWIARLESQGLDLRTRWRWVSFDGQTLVFDTPTGTNRLAYQVCILALGGASWRRLGSDGKWSTALTGEGVSLTPFEPANMGFNVPWSDQMRTHFGKAVKPVALFCTAGGLGDAPTPSRQGEFVITETGVEGSAIYAIARDARKGAHIAIDLLPNLTLDQVRKRLARPRGKLSMANYLRKTVRIEGVKRSLLLEFARPLPGDPDALATLLKAVPLKHKGPRPLDEAISTAGGVAWSALDADLMLTAKAGVFCAGEMLDWEAPTGGYLITGCLATGQWAGRAAARFLGSQGGL